MKKIEAVIFDWAGTTVDFGCFAPVNVFIDIFQKAGINVTMSEAREPMGMLKIDHIRAMLSMPRISKLWKERYGRDFNEDDVNDLYNKFEPALMESLSNYTDPIPGVINTVQALKEDGLKIGSTTGYTSKMMDIVVPNALKKGYQPDFYITADDTNSYGRPYPYMIFRNMEKLKLSSTRQVVKVGDTVSDIQEAINAGIWSVGVIIGSSLMGLSKEEFEQLSPDEKAEIIANMKKKFLDNGADFTIETMEELPKIIDLINKQL